MKFEKERKEMLREARNGEFIPQIKLASDKDTNGEVLKELFHISKYNLVKLLVALHSNCPIEIKVVNAL